MNKKYDIGILTFWDVPNYGTFAQAYALQKVLEQMNPDKDVRQIAHLDKRHFDFYYDKKSYLRSFSIKQKSFWKSFIIGNPDITARKKNFCDAYNLITHTENIDKSNVFNYHFDKIFLGSDIIWDYSIEPFNKDPMLFGEGFEAEINSYAASFGTIKIDAEIPFYVDNALKNMKHISVRDEKSAEIVKKITGVYPDVVLDPAWMWDFEKDNNIVIPQENNYILVYGQDFTDEFIKNLVQYAKKHRKSIIALDCNEDHYDWCDKLIGQEKLHPFQWIGYFKYADAVATSTFHGITFSLIFNKKMAFCKTQFIMDKIDTFLKEIGLFDLYDKNCDNVFGMFNFDFDYTKINEVINKKRTSSYEFLRNALED